MKRPYRGKSNRAPLVVALGIVCVLGAASWVLVERVAWKNGAYGDYGALLQGAAGSLALILLWYTVHLQQRELRLQRLELRMTRKEMRASRGEQKRLADEAHHQREFMQEQSEREYRPLLRVLLSNQGPRMIKLRNDGAGRAVVWEPRYYEEGREVAPLQRLSSKYVTRPPYHISFDIERLTEQQIVVGYAASLLVVHFQAMTEEQESEFLKDIGRLTIEVRYADVWGKMQPTLRIPLTCLQGIPSGSHRIFTEFEPTPGLGPA